MNEQPKKHLGKTVGDAAEMSHLWSAYRQTPVLARGQFRGLTKVFEGFVEKTGSAVASVSGTDPVRARDEIDHAIAVFEENPGGETLVKTPAAERILLENLTAQIGRHIRYLRLKNLVLGVYAVKLADLDAKPQTLLVKE